MFQGHLLAAILADPLTAPLPQTPHERIRLVLDLSMKEALAAPDKADMIVKFIERLPLETQVFFLWRAVNASEEFRKTPAFVKTVQRREIIGLVL